ncbi:MAG: amylo-alpha-1,6-glucosidase [Mangrovibacterium sp.]
MSYLKFDKSSLVNLEYSLAREFLRSNRTGSYISTTISGCNTRKYHGLLICPVPQLDGDKHVLLSSLDETIIQHNAEFNLGIHKYEGEHYEPKGHKYIRDFDVEIVAKTTFRVGGVVFDKEQLLVENDEQILIRYTLREAHSPTVLRLRPFLAFRSVHHLSKANMYAYTKYIPVPNGIKMRLYEGYPELHMQFSKEAEFIPVPVWYNNIEYFKERERGYDYLEDLFVPGYFEIPIDKNESIIFSASTFEVKPAGFKTKFTREYDGRIPRNSFINCLTNSARQFIRDIGNKADVIAGYPWYNGITRQTLVALPGLTLALDDPETFEKVIDTQIARLKDGLFPKTTDGNRNSYDSIDAPLWLFWALQQYVPEVADKKQIWKIYGSALKQILNAYRTGTHYHIRMNGDGLISGGDEYTALTWMDSYINGKPVVKRTGMPVEVNALWFNAVCFALELAGAANDLNFINEWEGWPEKIAGSFVREFWSEGRGYLADCVFYEQKDWTVRPNMVIAAAMKYSPLDREMQKSILSVAKKQLLTPRGLRSLTPESPFYEGLCEGDVSLREKAVHQGSVWPWLIQFFIEGYLRIHKAGGMPFIKKIIDGFEEDMSEHCIGTIAEMYNGNPPHHARGAVSQAWSVGAVIRAYKLINTFED